MDSNGLHYDPGDRIPIIVERDKRQIPHVAIT